MALHGYLTRDGIAPSDFNDLGRSELPRYGVEVRTVGVTDAQRTRITTVWPSATARRKHARFLLIATGVVDDLPAIPASRPATAVDLSLSLLRRLGMADRPIAAFGAARDAPASRSASKPGAATSSSARMAAQVDAAARERLRANGIAIREEPIAHLEHRMAFFAAIGFASGEPLPPRRDVLHDRAASAVRSRGSGSAVRSPPAGR